MKITVELTLAEAYLLSRRLNKSLVAEWQGSVGNAEYYGLSAIAAKVDGEIAKQERREHE
jgi:hypothetical protein